MIQNHKQYFWLKLALESLFNGKYLGLKFTTIGAICNYRIVNFKQEFESVKP